MDLRFTDDEYAFQGEARQFFRTAVPAAIRDKLNAGHGLTATEIRAWQQILRHKGWAVPYWPVEWGGCGWSPVQRYIFEAEMEEAPAPPSVAYGVSMVGPVIIAFGSEQQKDRFLPRIASLQDWWCQGFSEPGAGSDLASLKSSARREGNHYVVNGQKTWTTLAQHADWMFALVRTDPAAKKQAGISFLLFDMKSPGVTVRPIITIDGKHEVNEVFLDNVRVPAENLIGDENKGWEYAKFLLGGERLMVAQVGTSTDRIRRVRQGAAVTPAGDGMLIDDSRFRERLAAVEVELKALEITLLRAVAAEYNRRDSAPDPMSSILKIKGSEVQQAITELMLEVAGPLALPYLRAAEEPGLDQSPVGPDWAGSVAPGYFNRRKVSIYGGTNEIQRNIIAKAVLGL